VNWLGDAVMALPAIERLREHSPAARISLVTAAKLADLFVGHPAIDEVISFEKGEGAFAVGRRLRASAFDLALILPNSFRSAVEAWLARIPERVGYGGGGRNGLLTRAVARHGEEIRMRKRSKAEVRRLATRRTNRSRDTFPLPAHHLYNYLHLVAALGANPEPLAPRLVVSAAERAAFRGKFGISEGTRLLGLNPGAEYGPAKRWPVQNFIEAAKLTSNRVDCQWMIFGGAGDQETARSIQGALGKTARDLSGKTTLRELASGLSICDTVLTNDTGPMHLAAAVGSRVVVPFGGTAPELTGPGLPGAPVHQLLLGRAPCAPCFRRACPIDFRCMLSITPDRVAAAIVE
jgi:heptosyltransferase-2